MKIAYKNQTHIRNNSEVCEVTEYNIEDESLDFAIVKISGRYPSQGCAINSKCKEVVFINKGNGKVCVNGCDFLLQEGDVVLIDPNEKFYWEGEMQLFISCNPAFNVEQHMLVD